MGVYFISGIDTDAGKSVVTGIIAKTMLGNGERVITQKFIQTGCKGISEDILTHRRIMGVSLYEADKDGTTCPYVMSYPASPHLAAEIDGVSIDLGKIEKATEKLKSQYDTVLIEGAGGLFVPVTRDYFTVDYIVDHAYPLILVVSSKLGSINHSLTSMEICKNRGIDISHVVYNRYPETSPYITDDSVNVIRDYLKMFFPKASLLELPVVKGNEYPDLRLK